MFCFFILYIGFFLKGVIFCKIFLKYWMYKIEKVFFLLFNIYVILDLLKKFFDVLGFFFFNLYFM